MKFRKILISMLSVASILSGSFAPATSVMAAGNQSVEIGDVEVTKEQLETVRRWSDNCVGQK